jgi:hypothetical protein
LGSLKTTGKVILGVTIIDSVVPASLKLLDMYFSTSLRKYYPNLVKSLPFPEQLSKNSNPNYAYEHLAKDTLLHLETTKDKHLVKSSILQIYKETENNPILKYLLFVNALDSVGSSNIKAYGTVNIFHTGSIAYKMIKLVQKYLNLGMNINDINGIATSGYFLLYYTEIGPMTKEAFVHEMAHRAYLLVHNNNAEPYKENDIKTKDIYNKLLNNAINKVIKEPQSDTSTLTNSIKVNVFENNKVYSSDDISKEMIAIYLGKLANNEPAINDVFDGFKEFVLYNSIPDFKEYIITHPNCAKITFNDESLICKPLGVIEEL